jgi:hypothetical protein
MTYSWIWTNESLSKTAYTLCLEPCGMAIEVPAGSLAKYVATFPVSGKVKLELADSLAVFYPEGDWTEYSVEVDSELVYRFP